MNFLRLRAVALLLILASFGVAASLRASAEGEELRFADTELNAAYQRTLKAMPGEAAKEKLREVQRAWVVFRDAEVALHAAVPGASGNELKMLQTDLTEARTKQLKELAEAVKP